jgi:NAD(P)-dependent dehydrogenase (short-subunit alcohol dehydrogenase family)
MASLSGKVAIVTGASAPNGIGRAISMRLAEEGASVVVTDVDGKLMIDGEARATPQLLAGVVETIGAAGGTAAAMTLDVTSQQDIACCVSETIDRFGQVDILVNNAGSLAGSNDFLETDPAQWEQSFRVNLLGPMMLTQAVIPPMRAKGGGSIINIGSTGSLGAEAGFGAYTAMKHGLIGLTKTVAAEFGVNGIRCNAVCPGFIMTDMHAAANDRLAGEAGISVEEMKARRYANVALRSAGDPADVAEAVAYLAGPRAAYVTGIALPVAGGVSFGI